MRGGDEEENTRRVGGPEAEEGSGGRRRRDDGGGTERRRRRERGNGRVKREREVRVHKSKRQRGRVVKNGGDGGGRWRKEAELPCLSENNHHI